MKQVLDIVWNVEFVGDYFVLQTTVIANYEEQAIDIATNWLKEQYGFDMKRISNQTSAYEVAQ